jgi:hypothetical protein
MNIFRPHDFPLASGNTNAAPMNHPALLRPTISHHSVLLIFRRSLLLMLSDNHISALSQARTKSKSSWWNRKENEFTFNKFFEEIHKEKIKQATKSKT